MAKGPTIGETAQYLSDLLTLEICAAYHAGDKPQTKVRACAKRLAARAGSAGQVMVCQVWAVTAKMPMPIAHIEKLRNRVELACEGELTAE
ncbi:hypothetical protein Gekk315_00056 [Aeromonas phage Gekk3-15]